MTICGTDEYMAPEMLFDESFSYPADMFSFGELSFCCFSFARARDIAIAPLMYTRYRDTLIIRSCLRQVQVLRSCFNSDPFWSIPVAIIAESRV